MFSYQGKYPNHDEGYAPIPQGIYEESDTQKGYLGTVRRVGGRTFVYTKNGSVALSAGKLTIHPTVPANHQNVAVASAVAAGDNQITVTLGATAATLNQYQDGYLTVNDATGEGTCYKIRSNPAASASASLTLTLYDTVHTALDTTSEVCLTPNPWNGVIISIADQADVPAGVPLIDVTADYYFWLQTGGICPVLADEAIAQGQQLTIGSSVVGAVEAQDAAGEPVLGYAYMALVDTEYRPGYLTILN